MSTLGFCPNINFNQDIDIEYDFREWQYCIAKVSLSLNNDSIFFCLNIDADITLSNEVFFQKQFRNVSVRIMTISITVRDLEVNKYQIDKYAVVLMYFEDKNKSDDVVKTIIIREVHLIKDLKANLLIENDILKFELIDISTSINTAYIENCEVTILITINIRFKSQHMSVHALKTTTVLSEFECLIRIHNIALFDRDYLFESITSANFSIYAHVVNSKTDFILIQNNIKNVIIISRNFRLRLLNELNYFNVYKIDEEISNLALKYFKTEHKTAWFNKTLTIYTTVITLTSNISETKLNIDVIIHKFSVKAFNAFIDFINDYSKLWIDQEFVKLSVENWMRISLKFDWKKSIKNKIKVYSLNLKDKAVIDETFDDLQRQNKLSWTTNATFFSCFVIWKDFSDNRKNRVVVNVRDLNAITQLNAYSVSLQSNIIQAISDCFFISVIDCSGFFYQWKVHSTKKHKLTIIIHREQKNFNVIVMRFRNSSIYVQRQIDRILRFSKNFAKTYIDDIMIFFKSLKDHLLHLRNVFDILKSNNISIKSTKSFIDYFSVSLLNQRVNFFDLITDTQKLKTIFTLKFSKILKQLKTYLNFTKWFRAYIQEYAEKSKSLQNRKTSLLKNASLFEQARKFYTFKVKLNSSIFEELKSFQILQSHLSFASFLVHFDQNKQLYIDLNTSKKKDIDAMIYHVNITSFKEYSFRTSVQFILFLSRLLNSAKTRYWSIELELIELIWVLRKIRHLVESSKLSSIIYTDHEAFLRIAKQINLSIFSIDKLNLRLIRTFEYIQRFFLIIRHKSEKLHIISNVLFKLFITNNSLSSSVNNENEFDVLFTAFMIEMNTDFKKRMIESYRKNSVFAKILNVFEKNKNNIKLFFIIENKLLYKKKISDESTSFILRKMCVSQFMIKDVFAMTHHEFNEHIEFDRIYERLTNSWYIRDLSKQLINYFKHCFECQINRIRKHKFYENLQSILSSSILFHILTIDFVLILFISHTSMNNVMSITDKFSKRITIVSSKNTWTAIMWAKTLLERLDLANWNLSKVIIFDRNRKFLSKLWFNLFARLKVKLLYSTVYHSQTNDSFERTNQTIEIALRYHIQTFDDIKNWSSIVEIMQRTINNDISFIDKSLLKFVTILFQQSAQTYSHSMFEIQCHVLSSSIVLSWHKCRSRDYTIKSIKS